MTALEKEVRTLLHAAQMERKALLDRGRVDTVFQVGDEVLLRSKALLDAAEAPAALGRPLSGESGRGA